MFQISLVSLVLYISVSSQSKFSAYEGSFDYVDWIGPPISYFYNKGCNLNYIMQNFFCPLTYHIHKFQELGFGHLLRGGHSAHHVELSQYQG